MHKTKVVLVEDDPIVSALISDFLTQKKYHVAAFDDAPPALEHIQDQGLPHIALIDLSLPTMHGFELASQLKSMADVPIIFVTSADDTETIVQGLSRYAEDFVTKPFELRELEVRVQVVLRRFPSFDYANEPRLVVDDHLEIEFPRHRIYINGVAKSLTPTESKLLHVLLRNACRVVENQALIARVWPNEEVYDDTLRVHMHRLRHKLEHNSHHPYYIQTARKVGYMFTVPPRGWQNGSNPTKDDEAEA